MHMCEEAAVGLEKSREPAKTQIEPKRQDSGVDEVTAGEGQRVAIDVELAIARNADVALH
jgi:hypothetical protein